MNAFGVDIATMLDDLKLPLEAIRWKEILRGPELENLSAQQLLREVLEPQYIESMNNRYETNLRLSSLIDKSALVSNLVSGSVRRYNDEVVRQLLTFRFAQNRMNVGVYGITDAGKSYFMAAFCKEACRKKLPLQVCGLLRFVRRAAGS